MFIWSTTFGDGRTKFEKAIEDRKFQQSVTQFARDSGDAVRLIEAAVSAAPGGVAALLAALVARRLGYGAIAVGEGLAGLPGLASLAAVGAFGAAVMPQPLNAGEDERARQRKFGQSSSVGPRTQTPSSAGSMTTPGTRTDIQTTARTPAGETPILGDATHHPARYQGTLSVDGQTFDYASGSWNRGRGSSPFGEHPITGFDPTALHGRGGGAFRTKDVYDP